MFDLCTYTHQTYINHSNIQNIPLTKNVVCGKRTLGKHQLKSWTLKCF